MRARATSAELIPAPGRGQYDRRLPRERRLAEQRERLITATARALARSEAATVAEVVTIAGMGRNTFYEYFDAVPHARRAAESRGLRLLEDAIRAAEARTRTPVERLRALAQAWFAVSRSAPAEFGLMLRSPLASGLSPAGTAFEVALVRALETIRASGVVPSQREPLRLRVVAAAAEAFARASTIAALSENEMRAAASAEPERWERVLVDVAVQLLR